MAISIGEKEEIRSEPNVVPLCDVLLVLLIIFMVVTPLVQKGIDVRLPTALNTVNMPSELDVILTLRKDGTMYVNKDLATKDNLQTILEEAFLMVTEKKLYLKADQDVEYGKFVDIIEFIKDAGIEIVGIVTEKKAEKVD